MAVDSTNACCAAGWKPASGFARVAGSSLTSSLTGISPGLGVKRGALMTPPHRGQGPSTPAALAGITKSTPHRGQVNPRWSISIVAAGGSGKPDTHPAAVRGA
ncbi:MAG: hypothetical protein KF712_14995 [Akkermansiaceae bacterium]|nr:hypothetical protein [Akkermansiaceae bacterium]